MAEFQIKVDARNQDSIMLEFSTGYKYRFYRDGIERKIRIVPDGHLALGKRYRITKVKILKAKEHLSKGFWWLGGARMNYALSFQYLLDDIAPGCLGKGGLVGQIIAERIE